MMRVNEKGFSMVEVLIVLAILGLVLVLVTDFQLAAFQSWRSGESQASAYRDMQLGLDWINRDVRSASGVVCSGDTLIVDNIEYYVAGRQLVRESSEGILVAVRDMDEVSFSCSAGMVESSLKRIGIDGKVYELFGKATLRN